jgi:hypothetical protein
MYQSYRVGRRPSIPWAVLPAGTRAPEHAARRDRGRGVSDGARRRFQAGDLVFVADTTGRGHVTVAVGKPPFEALFVPAPGPSSVD